MTERPTYTGEKVSRIQNAITMIDGKGSTSTHEIYHEWKNPRIDDNLLEEDVAILEYASPDEQKRRMRQLHNVFREGADFQNALQAVIYGRALEHVAPIACDDRLSWVDLSAYAKEQEAYDFHHAAGVYLPGHPREIIDFIATIGSFTHQAYDNTVRLMKEEDPTLYETADTLDTKKRKAHRMIRDIADMHLRNDATDREVKEMLDSQRERNELPLPEYSQKIAEIFGGNISNRIFLFDLRGRAEGPTNPLVNNRASRMSNARTTLENLLLDTLAGQFHGLSAAQIHQHLVESSLTDRTVLKLAAAPAFYLNGEKDTPQQQRNFSDFIMRALPWAIKNTHFDQAGYYVPEKSGIKARGGRCPVQHTAQSPSHAMIRNALAEQYGCEWLPPSSHIEGEMRIADIGVALSLLMGGRQGGPFDIEHNGGPLGIAERYIASNNLPPLEQLLE